jgi:amino acid transporter
MPNLLKRILVGAPLPTAAVPDQRLGKPTGLAVFASDNLSSSAYATEEILLVLIATGSASVWLSLPVAVAIGLLQVILTISYRQTIHAYPSGGGAYIVARSNLGDHPGLIAAAALLIDYVLTVAVSVAAGVAALTSAVPTLHAVRVELCLLALAFITTANLRGVKESGRLFAGPTYGFITMVLFLIAAGLFRFLVWGAPAASPGPSPSPAGVEPLSMFLVLRAFASGCVAVTGVEAIANGIQAFRPPESDNAATTLSWMSAILMTLFLGLTALAYLYGVWPRPEETVVSQIGRIVFGEGWLYYALQGTTMLILVLAANTSYAGFPRLASILARDRVLPRQFANLGDRLVFSNGILVLAALSALVLLFFRGETHALIPLYAVGVFLSFTLSQAGMVVHWCALKNTGWAYRAFVNGVGTIMTAIALGVIVATKFTHGAWIVVVLIPLEVMAFRRIQRHYWEIGEAMKLRQFQVPDRVTQRVLVLVGNVDRGLVNALTYARSLSPEAQAVHVSVDAKATEALRARWPLWAGEFPLVILESPYRSLIQPLREYVDELQQKTGADFITLVIPELVPGKWWHHFLHNQSALLIKWAFLFRRGTVVLNVPYHLKD